MYVFIHLFWGGHRVTYLIITNVMGGGIGLENSSYTRTTELKPWVEAMLTN
jgi:hypothetical protein